MCRQLVRIVPSTTSLTRRPAMPWYFRPRGHQMLLLLITAKARICYLPWKMWMLKVIQATKEFRQALFCQTKLWCTFKTALAKTLATRISSNHTVSVWALCLSKHSFSKRRTALMEQAFPARKQKTDAQAGLKTRSITWATFTRWRALKKWQISPRHLLNDHPRSASASRSLFVEGSLQLARIMRAQSVDCLVDCLLITKTR